MCVCLCVCVTHLAYNIKPCFNLLFSGLQPLCSCLVQVVQHCRPKVFVILTAFGQGTRDLSARVLGLRLACAKSLSGAESPL